ncbi:MAG TPA: hypothetical protein VF516_05990 [Kofleriaceae bacterium]
MALDVDIDDDVDLDSSVELDGSEAIRKRLTPPSTSTSSLPSRSVEARAQDRSTSNVDGGLNVVRRRTSPSTSTLWVNHQVDVDDHERHLEDL